jgi:hypothetical protein
MFVLDSQRQEATQKSIITRRADMADQHVLILVHGMITAPDPSDHQSLYWGFLERLTRAEPRLEGALNPHIFVEWGHQTSNSAELRKDERLTAAQSFLAQIVDYSRLRNQFHPNNKLISDWSFLFPVRGVLNTIRESLVLHGLGDAIYYCSTDGETAVRKAVYGQVLAKIRPYEGDNVYLHVIGHSLGATVAYDFLYGLFAPSINWGDQRPDFGGDPEYGVEYLRWREKRENGSLHLGSMSSMASILPILLLRSQSVVDRFYHQQTLDPQVVGVDPGAGYVGRASMILTMCWPSPSERFSDPMTG